MIKLHSHMHQDQCMSIARSTYKDALLRIGWTLPLMLLAAAEDNMVLFTFVEFLLNHTTANMLPLRRTSMDNLKYEIYEKNPEDMTNMFQEPIEFLTKSDIARAMWPCTCSYEHWCSKKDNIADKGREHKPQTRFTMYNKWPDLNITIQLRNDVLLEDWEMDRQSIIKFHQLSHKVAEKGEIIQTWQ